MSYRCHSCGEMHEGLPDIDADYPDQYWSVPAGERTRRVEIAEDTCIIDGEDFFIRGVIQIPLYGISMERAWEIVHFYLEE